MFDRMIKKFVKDADNVDNPAVRERYGVFSGIVGIILNVLLSLAKITVGLVVGAISILSDGVNNLSDAASSVVTLLGFKLAGKKADKQHPFGHGRMEYFAGLIVSAIIIIVAIELAVSSVKKIAAGETTDYSSTKLFAISLTVLGVSILVKLWMTLFNRKIAKKINSVANGATALDSLSDCVATAVVILCAILSKFIKGVPLDGIAGLLVAIFIAYTGASSLKSIADLLLGAPPDHELVKEITDFALNFDKQKIIGIHDLIVNDYGPGRKIIILHAEVPAKGDVMQLHDAIDNLENALAEKFGCMAVIHMDPVDNESERVAQLKETVRHIVKELDPEYDVHDFRMNEGDTHANLIFDLVIPYDEKYTEKQIRDFVTTRIEAVEPNCVPKFKIEHSLSR